MKKTTYKTGKTCEEYYLAPLRCVRRLYKLYSENKLQTVTIKYWGEKGDYRGESRITIPKYGFGRVAKQIIDALFYDNVKVTLEYV